MDETIYAIRRADGELIGDYTYIIVDGPDDWWTAEDESLYGEPTDYEMLKMTVEVVATRTLPECAERCGEPGEFWGLCRMHAEEDDPETLREMLARPR